MTRLLLPAERLPEYLTCDFSTGELWWRERPLAWFARRAHGKTWNTRFAGQPALTSWHDHGYRCGAIHGHKYLAHRVIWALYHGRWPEHAIDHINRIKADNRIANLRDVSRRKNTRNSSVRTGVTAHSHGGYQARIGRRYLGYYPTIAEAAAARQAAERIIWGGARRG